MLNSRVGRRTRTESHFELISHRRDHSDGRFQMLAAPNFMNYPGFLHTMGADKDPKKLEAILDMIPMARLGEEDEAAHFCAALLDGQNMYTTGNFFPVGGGFNNAGMPF